MKNYYLVLFAICIAHFSYSQNVNIPDTNFKNALLTHYPIIDTNGDGEIQESEANVFTGDLNVQGKYISNLTGIEAFTAITNLNCSFNQIPALSVTELTNLQILTCNNNNISFFASLSQNIFLRELYCNDNSISNLGVTQNTLLEILDCERNEISGLNLTNNTNLKKLNCNTNELTNLDITQNINLEELQCRYNSLSNLDLTQCINLEILSCTKNLLTNLDITQNQNLQIVDCSRNQLSSIDLTNNTSLIELFCSKNQLVNLDLTQNVSLTKLYTELNQITSIDLTQNINLRYLNIRSNSLASIDLTQNTNIASVNCSYNSLINLDVSQNTALSILECDGCGLTSLDVSQNLFLNNLKCNSNDLTSLDITNNTHFLSLECNYNDLTSLDITNNDSLNRLYCGYNSLTAIDLTQNVNLQKLYLKSNDLTSLDVNTNVKLLDIDCSYNSLTNLEVTQNDKLYRLRCENNSLVSLFMKNGKALTTFTSNLSSQNSSFSSNSSLEYICVDDFELNTIQQLASVNCVVNSYCSFVPGGNFYTINGETRLDVDLNDCDTSDPLFPNLKMNITNGVVTGSLIVDTTGDYSIEVQAGTHTITPQFENPTYFTVLPTNIVINFPTAPSPVNQNFCVIPNGEHNDLEIILLPIKSAIPGFYTTYQLVYKNKGTTTLSGAIGLAFNDNIQSFASAIPSLNSQTTGNLTWNYTNLQPFETRTIEFTMNINTPTDPSFPVNNGDILDFTATISPVLGDETPDDNVFELHQTVVNSYDPNDKTCLEGKTISPSEVGEYVHYIIRFENNGTANATNIVVKDVIDVAMYDVSTLIPLHGSDNYFTRINKTNEVEFIFENINLPFDDANNDGFVAFKIKTLPTLVVNDTFENEAEIYFDYNFPIITDKEITTVMTPLGVSEYILDSSLKIYPNPGKNFIKISGNNNLENIMLYDINGRLLQEVKILGNQIEKELSLEQLASGIYLIKVQSDKGVLLEKLVKK